MTRQISEFRPSAGLSIITSRSGTWVHVPYTAGFDPTARRVVVRRRRRPSARGGRRASAGVASRRRGVLVLHTSTQVGIVDVMMSRQPHFAVAMSVVTLALLVRRGSCTVDEAQPSSFSVAHLRRSHGRGRDTRCIEPPPPLRGRDLSAQRRSGSPAPDHLKYLALDGSTDLSTSDWTNLGFIGPSKDGRGVNETELDAYLAKGCESFPAWQFNCTPVSDGAGFFDCTLRFHVFLDARHHGGNLHLGHEY
jgi:hypothetical protein